MIMHALRQTLGRLDDQVPAVPSLINVRSEIMCSSTNRTRTGKSSFDERVQHQDCVKSLEWIANRIATSILSLSRTGTPCGGQRAPLRRAPYRGRLPPP